MKCRTYKKRPVRCSRFFESGASCQAALHGCPPAEIAAIYFAAQQHTSETNPLREAALLQKKGPSPQPVSFPGKMNYRGVFRLCGDRFFASRVLAGIPVTCTSNCPVKRSKTHGSRKTRYQAPGTAQKVSSSLRASYTSPRRKPRTAQIATRFAIAASRSVNIAACGFSGSEQPLV